MMGIASLHPILRADAMETAPSSGTVTLAPGKHAGEVALVDKAAELGNIGEFPVRVP
jgi:hypothetical protein